MILNNKGLTIVESLIAVMVTGIAVIGLLTMTPLSFQSAGKADSIAHASEIMQRELEQTELRIMTGHFSALSDLNKTNVSEKIGNETFTINTAVTVRTVNTWLVRTRVTWPGNSRGVKSSLIASRQTVFD